MATAVTLKPKVDVLSGQQSMNMLKNTIRIGISSIAYLRNLFEEDVFDEATVSGLALKQLRPCHPEARLILEWLNEGVFDALEKHYLRLVVLGIHGHNDNLIECYHFCFKYKEENPVVVMSLKRMGDGIKDPLISTTPEISCSKDEAREQSVQLLKSLILLTQSFGPLPECRYVSMKLWYNDDKVPDEYEPQGFRAATEKEALQFGDAPIEIDVGEVDTGHHNMSLRVKTTCDEGSVFCLGTDGDGSVANHEASFPPMLSSANNRFCAPMNITRNKSPGSGCYGEDLSASKPLTKHRGENEVLPHQRRQPNSTTPRKAKTQSMKEVIEASAMGNGLKEAEADQGKQIESANSGTGGIDHEALEEEAMKLFNEAIELAQTSKYLKKETLISGLGIEEIVAKPLLNRLIIEGVLKKKPTRGKGHESVVYEPTKRLLKRAREDSLKDTQDTALCPQTFDVAVPTQRRQTGKGRRNAGLFSTG